MPWVISCLLNSRGKHTVKRLKLKDSKHAQYLFNSLPVNITWINYPINEWVKEGREFLPHTLCSKEQSLSSDTADSHIWECFIVRIVETLGFLSCPYSGHKRKRFIFYCFPLFCRFLSTTDLGRNWGVFVLWYPVSSFAPSCLFLSKSSGLENNPSSTFFIFKNH